MSRAEQVAGGVPPAGRVRLRYAVAGWASASRSGPGHDNGDRIGADGQLFSLADGVGGLVGGGRAAGAAIRSLHGSMPHDLDSLQAAVFGANTAVRDLQRRAGVSMGSTLTVLLVGQYVGQSDAAVVSVGDSRAYLLRSGELRQLTVDDNAAAAQGVGFGDPDYPLLAARLTRCLGAEPVLEAEPFLLEVGTDPVRVLLTSDGVHDALSSECLTDVAGGEADPGTVAAALVGAAADHGTTDDASVLVVDLTVDAVPVDAQGSEHGR